MAELQVRPSYEDVVVTYTRLDQEMRAAIAAVAPTVVWAFEREGITAGCREPFDNLGGTGGGLDSYGAPGGIPDDDWPAAYTAARDVAARFGFTDTASVVDEPGNHQARFRNPSDDAYINLGTRVNAVLANFTGCNLPQAGRRLSATP